MKFINFAGDTTVYTDEINSNAMYDVLTEELMRVGDWLLGNRLSVNIDNTGYMIATNKKFERKELTILGEVIEKINFIKLIGVTSFLDFPFKNMCANW